MLSYFRKKQKFQLKKLLKILYFLLIKKKCRANRKRENIENSTFPLLYLEAPPGFEPGIRVLQTRALPLGYSAIFSQSIFIIA